MSKNNELTPRKPLHFIDFYPNCNGLKLFIWDDGTVGASTDGINWKLASYENGAWSIDEGKEETKVTADGQLL